MEPLHDKRFTLLQQTRHQPMLRPMLLEMGVQIALTPFQKLPGLSEIFGLSSINLQPRVNRFYNHHINYRREQHDSGDEKRNAHAERERHDVLGFGLTLGGFVQNDVQMNRHCALCSTMLMS